LDKDVIVEVAISRRESLEGCHRLVRLRRQRLIDGRLREYRETLRTEIPPLAELDDDAVFRLRGKGHEAIDGTSGDAVLRLVVGRVQALPTARRFSGRGLRVLVGLLSLGAGVALPFMERLPIVVHALADTALGFLLIAMGITLLWDVLRPR
jgi:hypothetical protein